MKYNTAREPMGDAMLGIRDQITYSFDTAVQFSIKSQSTGKEFWESDFPHVTIESFAVSK